MANSRPFYRSVAVLSVLGMVGLVVTTRTIRNGWQQLQAGDFVTMLGWLVAAVITAVGWIVSQNGQKKLFKHQIKNTARGEIVAEVRAYQSVLRDWSVCLFSLATNVEVGITRGWAEADWQRWLRESDTARDNFNRTSMTSTLEQYELLFPATRTGRQDLGTYSGQTYVQLSDLSLGIANPRERDRAAVYARPIHDRMFHESLLWEDLLVYIQNEALGDIVGRHVPFFRPPRFAGTPRLMLINGELFVTNADGTRMFPRQGQAQ